MITGKAADRVVAVEVAPGGALQELTLEPSALRLAPSELARRILLLSAAASARATASLWHVEGLGLPSADEAAEETTPASWRTQ